jgi:hypothetical protein
MRWGFGKKGKNTKTGVDNGLFNNNNISCSVAGDINWKEIKRTAIIIIFKLTGYKIIL